MHYVETQTQSDKYEALTRKAANLLSCFQCSKARKHLQLNGLGDHTNPDIINQMERKYPLWKKGITPLTATELQAERKGISCK